MASSPRVLASLLASAALLAGMLAVPGAAAEEATTLSRVVVKVRPGAQLPENVHAASAVGDVWRVLEPSAGESVDELVAMLRRDPAVEHAYEEHVYHAAGTLGYVDPNDPGYDLQWHLHNIGLPEAWKGSTGNGVRVGVIDTGVSRGEDLRCRALAGEYDAINNETGTGSASDDSSVSHGTHIAGTVAQCTDNGVGVGGVAPDARLLAVKALTGDGVAFESDVARGIRWATDNDASVLNLSFGMTCLSPWPTCGGTSLILNDAIKYAASHGVVLVAASGNDGLSFVSHPANHPDVIGVGATRINRTRAPYSSYGADLSLVAPGGDLNQDGNGDGQPDGVLQGVTGSGYRWLSGTSMATPHVAAVAALLRAAKPSMSRTEVQRVLESTARDLGPAGEDVEFGHGEVRAAAALKKVLGSLDDPMSFEDVPTSHTFHDDILWLARAGITKGCNPPENTRFCPDRDVSRAQMAAFVVRALGLTETSRGGRFSDVPAGHTFAKDINKLATAGVTKGCNPPDNTRFCPDRDVSRAQMAAFVVRALGLTETSGDGRFSDVPAGHTFATDINKLATAGVTKGCNPPDNTRFCPDRDVTRAQMAAFLHRALG